MEIKKITVGHFYPELLNLYGDRGNIASLLFRARARGIEAEVKAFALADDVDFGALDIAFLGGGSDREQLLVCKRLRALQSDFTAYVADGGACLAVCGGYQLLGKYYRLENELVEGLSIFDAYTETGAGKKRLIGNVVLDGELDGKNVKIAGFENHGGRTYLGEGVQPLGRVLHGFGNNERDGREGAVYKNCVGTYLHGPLLPKNPEIADFLLQKALERKNNAPVELPPLDDEAETAAKDYILNRFVKRR